MQKHAKGHKYKSTNKVQTNKPKKKERTEKKEGTRHDRNGEKEDARRGNQKEEEIFFAGSCFDMFQAALFSQQTTRNFQEEGFCENSKQRQKFARKRIRSEKEEEEMKLKRKKQRKEILDFVEGQIFLMMELGSADLVFLLFCLFFERIDSSCVCFEEKQFRFCFSYLISRASGKISFFYNK